MDLLSMSLPRVGNERLYNYAGHVLFLKMNGMYKSANCLILVQHFVYQNIL